MARTGSTVRRPAVKSIVDALRSWPPKESGRHQNSSGKMAVLGSGSQAGRPDVFERDFKMLVLRIKVGTSFTIGKEITVTIVKSISSMVTLVGIDAPDDLAIHRDGYQPPEPEVPPGEGQ